MSSKHEAEMVAVEQVDRDRAKRILGDSMWEGVPERNRNSLTLVRELARHRLTATRAPDIVEAWQPIDTAPHDQEKVLLWINDPRAPVVTLGQWDDDRYAKKPRPYWRTDDERICGTLYRRANQPTYWQPLPAPPGATLTDERAAEMGEK